MLDLTSESAEFKLCLKQSGKLFGIVLYKNESVPTNVQIRSGLKSNNKLMLTGASVSVAFKYKEHSHEESFIYKRVIFQNLYENTDYIAYFIGENDLPVNPDLMDDHQIQS